MPNPQRVLVGGRRNDISGERAEQRRAGSPPLFHRATVIEVFSDPERLTEETKRQLRDSVQNPEFLENMPANTLLCRFVSNAQDSLLPTPSVVYPLLPSHIGMPIQAGEHVWVLYEDFQSQGNSLGRWLCRIHENQTVEDPNFTHADRRFIPSATTQPRTSQRNQDSNAPFFPNGGGTLESQSLQQSPNEENPYEVIYRDSLASRLHNYEPVPRWKKRPNELVFQGMNNSAIILGDDREGKVNERQSWERQRSGNIDLICGLGRYPLAPTQNSDQGSRKTSALTIENTRRKLETDKTPRSRNRSDNEFEGTPDRKTDASRIHLTMNSKLDERFRLVNSTDRNVGLNYPPNTLPVAQPPDPGQNLGPSYVFAKADHIRLVARKERTPEGANINGTVLVIREGDAPADLGYLLINDRSEVQLYGNKIFLGQATQENEPYIKWTIYNQHITELKRQINALADQVATITAAYEAAFSSAIAVPFSNVASLAAAGPTVNNQTTGAVNGIKTAVDNINPDQAKSTRIFGE